MSDPLVVVDADVLGRHRTGDETYVLNLLRELPEPAAAAGLRIAAVTRHPELVPAGIEAIELATSSQELRMAWSLPRLLGRVGADLVHTQYTLPLRCPCPGVVTIHDLSFERGTAMMGRRDRLVFRRTVPRSARRAARVLTVSERSRRDLVELYGLPESSIVVTPNGADPAFRPGDGGARDYVLSVGADPAAEEPAGGARGGPGGRAPARRRRARRRMPRRQPSSASAGPRCAATSRSRSSPPSTAAPRVSCRRPSTRASACRCSRRWRAARRSSPCATRRCSRSPATPPFSLPRMGSPDGIRYALEHRDELAAAGLERARLFSWRSAAERTVEVYREALGR